MTSTRDRLRTPFEPLRVLHDALQVLSTRTWSNLRYRPPRRSDFGLCPRGSREVQRSRFCSISPRDRRDTRLHLAQTCRYGTFRRHTVSEKLAPGPTYSMGSMTLQTRNAGNKRRPRIGASRAPTCRAWLASAKVTPRNPFPIIPCFARLRLLNPTECFESKRRGNPRQTHVQTQRTLISVRVQC